MLPELFAKSRTTIKTTTHTGPPGGGAPGISKKNQEKLNFHESTLGTHLGGAEHRGGIHLAQLATVGEQIII